MSDIGKALTTLLTELVDGAAADSGWLLNPRDEGLLRSLERLTASAASEPAPGGGASIAAHVDHLCYGFELLNRWSRAENPFADADFSASWRRQTVTDQEWAALRERLSTDVRKWQQKIGRASDLNQVELTGVIAAVSHLAYHMGAIRQIDRATRGPSARD
jgi:hypothetical protein